MGTVKVSNGEESFEVDESKLARAAKDGFVPTIKVTNGKDVFDIHPSRLGDAKQDGFELGDKKSSDVIDYGLRALDFERGAGSAALAKTMGVYDPERYAQAVKGQADFPSTQELLEKKGWADKDSLGGFLAGFIGDVATTPSSYASLGTSALAKKVPALAKYAKNIDFLRYLNPVGEVAGQGANLLGKKIVSPIGEKVYKSAFKKLDDAAEKTALKSGTSFSQIPSDIMLERGAPSAWTARGVGKKVEDVSRGIIDERNQILSMPMGGKGTPFDFDRMTSGLQAKAQQLKSSGLTDEISRGESILGEIEKDRAIYSGTPAVMSAGVPPSVSQVPTGLFDQNGQPVMRQVLNAGQAPKVVVPAVPARQVTPMSLNETKMLIGDKMPSAFSSATNTEKKILRDQYSGIKKEVENISADPDKVRSLNQQASALFPSENVELSLALQEERSNPLNALNFVIGSMSPQALAAKAIVDAAGRQGPRTKIGSGVLKAGKSLQNPWALEILTRQAITPESE